MNKLFEKYDGQHNPGRKEAKLKENTILKVSIYVECRAYWKPTLLTNAQDSFNFDADPDPGSALEKMDPDPGQFFMID